MTEQPVKKQKILFVITKGVWGGAQKYVFDLATSLQGTFEVIVAYGTEGALSQKLKEQNIRMIRIESLGRDINPFLDIASFFKLLFIYMKEKPDIAHVNSSKIGGLGTLAGRLLGIQKIIFTAHGWAFNEDRSPLSKKIIWVLSWLTALFSTHIIVLGEKEKIQATIMPWISSKKVSLIRLGISTPVFLDRETARRELAEVLHKSDAFFNAKTVVGSIAELVPNKGLVYALLALKDVPNVSYINIGGGGEKEFLKKKVEEDGLGSRAFFTGFIQDAEKYLKAFDIFLLPSLKEGLPYVLLAAGSAGLPVVATNVGAIPDLIENNTSGILIHSKNPQEIASSIITLLKDSHERASMGAKLQEKVQREFNKEMMVEKTKNLYQS